ncbi:transcriptional regulator [Xanthomonas sacchari]|uniref:transcriptional regulator n=1 Tax=Xanthomonas sacchari TaxID=56458 RepID=UPI00224F211A|nr:transcriptional regulator [Xanthomonas sacchari]UYK65729.1 transcriptional regulator [Xanthomonas sacchari]
MGSKLHRMVNNLLNPAGVGEALRSSRALTLGLADALFTRTQQRVLGLLYGQPQRSFGVGELIAAASGGSGAVQRELTKLADAGLLTVQRIGNQKRYQANPHSPIHDELLGIVQKTIGLAGPLGEALQPIVDDIVAAFVYGSVAKHSDTARSDIDLMVISDTLGYADLMRALDGMQARLGRPVNPTLYTRADYAKRLRDENAFLQRVLQQPKIWVIGGMDDLAT